MYIPTAAVITAVSSDLTSLLIPSNATPPSISASITSNVVVATTTGTVWPHPFTKTAQIQNFETVVLGHGFGEQHENTRAANASDLLANVSDHENTHLAHQHQLNRRGGTIFGHPMYDNPFGEIGQALQDIILGNSISLEQVHASLWAHRKDWWEPFRLFFKPIVNVFKRIWHGIVSLFVGVKDSIFYVAGDILPVLQWTNTEHPDGSGRAQWPVYTTAAKTIKSACSTKVYCLTQWPHETSPATLTEPTVAVPTAYTTGPWDTITALGTFEWDNNGHPITKVNRPPGSYVEVVQETTLVVTGWSWAPQSSEPPPVTYCTTVTECHALPVDETTKAKKKTKTKSSTSATTTKSKKGKKEKTTSLSATYFPLPSNLRAVTTRKTPKGTAPMPKLTGYSNHSATFLQLNGSIANTSYVHPAGIPIPARLNGTFGTHANATHMLSSAVGIPKKFNGTHFNISHARPSAFPIHALFNGSNGNTTHIFQAAVHIPKKFNGTHTKISHTAPAAIHFPKLSIGTIGGKANISSLLNATSVATDSNSTHTNTSSLFHAVVPILKASNTTTASPFLSDTTPFPANRTRTNNTTAPIHPTISNLTTTTTTTTLRRRQQIGIGSPWPEDTEDSWDGVQDYWAPDDPDRPGAAPILDPGVSVPAPTSAPAKPVEAPPAPAKTPERPAASEPAKVDAASAPAKVHTEASASASASASKSAEPEANDGGEPDEDKSDRLRVQSDIVPKPKAEQSSHGQGQEIAKADPVSAPGKKSGADDEGKSVPWVSLIAALVLAGLQLWL